MWNDHAGTYDEWYNTFEGAVENYVDWELLKKYLPENKNAKILDAGGGTGRIAIPLAKMGYSVTLCDLSPRMLDVAKKKVLEEGLSDRIEVLECDIHKLRFPDESFDFVLCWDGATDARKELLRVTKRGGRISLFLNNKWSSAIRRFRKNPDSSLALVQSSPGYLENEEGKHRVITPQEAKELFEAEGIKVLEIYAVCGWTDVLGIPEEVRKSRDWDEMLFRHSTEMVLKLCREPSVMGMSRHLVLYGEKN
jgi:ubiquinone/menaquinone biosynthesis C-methylase UbiE